MMRRERATTIQSLIRRYLTGPGRINRIPSRALHKSFMKHSLFSVLFIVSALSSNAQSLVSDIRTGSMGADPRLSAVMNDKLYFIANNGSTGNELFVYDGVNPPSLVFDLLPGAGSGADTPTRSLVNYRMGVLNNKLYFGGNEYAYGKELYSYDGTASAPVLISDIVTGAQDSAPYEFITHNNKVYFVATSKSEGREMFSYDGSTIVCLDNLPGLDGYYPGHLAVANNKFYFNGQTYYEGNEPYEYDPSTGVTKRLSDIRSGQPSSHPYYFTGFGGKMYFIANDFQHGWELYVYNGTTTTRITDLISQDGSGVTNVFAYNNTLMLSASTDNATYQLHTFDPVTNKATTADAVNGPSALGPANFIAYNGNLYFSALDPMMGRELFMYDGTGISMVMDINPGAGSSAPSDFTILKGQLTFTADNGTNGRELYKMGTAAGIERAGFQGSAVIYPNPTTGNCQLKLSLKQSATIVLKLSDATGKTVYSTEALSVAPSGTIAIPADNFAAGNYFYHLYNEGGQLLTGGKMVKQ